MQLLGPAVVLVTACTLARASTITYVTPTGSSTSGGAVDASATFTTNDDGTVNITLTDLEANPTDVAQLISDVDFTFSNGATTGALSSGSGQEITVAKNGTFTLGSKVATGWLLNDGVAGGLQLDVLGGAGPAHLIIGPSGPGDVYSNANGSIAGNKPHNPFLDGTATFTLDVPGVTSATTITSATFSFGTTDGIDVPGTPGTSTSVPEPATYMLFSSALGLVALAKRFRKV